VNDAPATPAIAQQREQQHRPATEPVAQVTEYRRAEELHERIYERQPAAVAGSLIDADAGQLHQQPRQHRQDDAEADRIDQHGDEDE
jgi:RecB family exonuclease